MKHLHRYAQFVREGSRDTWYHGSDELFDEFSLSNNKTYREFDIPAWFFTKDLGYAESYGQYVYAVELSVSYTLDTSREEHYELFLEFLRSQDYSPDEIEEVLDEQFFVDLPYWTCGDAFWCAVTNGFDSVMIAEELERDVRSIGVFDRSDVAIVDRWKAHRQK